DQRGRLRHDHVDRHERRWGVDGPERGRGIDAHRQPKRPRHVRCPRAGPGREWGRGGPHGPDRPRLRGRGERPERPRRRRWGRGGAVEIYNQANVNSRSQIRGSVLVSYLDGNTDLDDVLADAEVGGNVTFAHGPGSFRTDIDARQTTLPVIVRGNLTVGGAR